MKVKNTVPPVTATKTIKRKSRRQGEPKDNQAENRGFWSQFFDRFSLEEDNNSEEKKRQNTGGSAVIFPMDVADTF